VEGVEGDEGDEDGWEFGGYSFVPSCLVHRNDYVYSSL